MKARRLHKQPHVAIVTCALAAGVIWLSTELERSSLKPTSVALVVGLTLAVAISYRFPVHVSNNLKLYMASAPLLILAATVQPAVAAGAAGLGVLAGELLARRTTGAEPSDVATSAGRYALIVLGTAIVAHGGGIASVAARLLAAVAVYWAVEALTLPLIISPINGEQPLRVVRNFVSDVGVSESCQYVLGILGALVAVSFPWMLPLLTLPTAIVYRAFKQAREMQETTVQMLESMADAVDLRDPNTGGHSRRVAEHTRAIVHAMGKVGPEAELVVSAARVHDIGKIGLPDSVLLKQGRLSPEEESVMQGHPETGAQLLRRYGEFARGMEIVRHHHERWDGLGYPGRLKGNDIPFGARIVAVADAYDAMTGDRPYRIGMPSAVARRILREGSGTQWDPQIVSVFLKLLDRDVIPESAIKPAEIPTLVAAGSAA